MFDGLMSSEERNRAMMSIGCDLHTRYRQIPMLDTNTGELVERSLGIRQPDVSKMLRGEFLQASVERLLRFLAALDQDVEIVMKPHRNRNDAAAMQVV